MRALALVSTMVWLGVAGQLVRPSAAVACSWPADSVLVRDTPVNSVVIVRTQCVFGFCFDGELPEELAVVDAVTRDPIAGEIVRMEGDLASELMIAWRPAQPLTLDRSYEVMWQPDASQDFADLDFVFQAIAPLQWTADDFHVEAQLSLGSRVHESIHCEATYTDSCGGNTAGVTFSERSYVSLNVPVTLAVPPELSDNLYVIRAAFWPGGSEPPELEELSWLAREQAWHGFEEVADEYCYRIEVTNLVDDSVHMHSECVPHGVLGALRTTPRSDDDIVSELAYCVDVVEGYELLWCQGRRAVCEGFEINQTAQEGCDTIDAACDAIEAAPPTDPTDPIGSADPMDNPSDPNDSPSDPNDDPSDPNNTPSDPNDTPSDPNGASGDPADDMGDAITVSRGCSVSPSNAASHAWLVLIAAGLVLVRRARRRAD